MHEEDEIRIISKDRGADLHRTYERLSRAVTAIEEILTFAHTDHLGYISSCPTNIGTGLRALVRLNLPLLSKPENAELFNEIAELHNV